MRRRGGPLHYLEIAVLVLLSTVIGALRKMVLVELVEVQISQVVAEKLSGEHVVDLHQESCGPQPWLLVCIPGSREPIELVPEMSAPGSGGGVSSPH